MKKFLTSCGSILLSVMMLFGVVGCGECQHVDTDHDQKCDNCNADVACTHLHADDSEDFDNTCDWCGGTLPRSMRHSHDYGTNGTCECGDVNCTAHVDNVAPFAKCDVCGADMACPGHVDTNNDQQCEYCGAVVCSNHVDSNAPFGKCDVCGADVQCNHRDSDHDQDCDLCGAPVACPHLPADDSDDYDDECDWCGETLPANMRHVHTDVDVDGYCDVCFENAHNHVDANHDQICDDATCGAAVPCTHTDADNDDECDWCGESLAHTHVDANSDCVCDDCREAIPHVDADSDCACDVCEAAIPHVDADSNNACDVCGTTMQAGHTHVDINKDCVCDSCSEPIDHVDADEDCKCDVCKTAFDHVDANSDCACDVCEKELTHVDDDWDCMCDTCGNESHVLSADGYSCEVCGESLRDCAAEGHLDKNKDGKCDADGANFSMPIITVYFGITSDTREIIEGMGAYFNENVFDGTFLVDLKVGGNVSSSAGTYLAGGSADVTESSDKEIKSYMASNYLLDLNPYVADGSLNIDGLYDNAVNRLRLNTATGEAGVESAPLYGVPMNSNPAVCAYNLTAIENAEVYVISVPESQLAAYNATNGTSYLPHGFYRYDVDPSAGEALETTLGEDEGYFIFNDQIAMSWEELRQFGQYFTQEHNSTSDTRYAYYSEWWFNYGWSVGGDCLENGLDAQGNHQLKFTLADKNPNYLVTAPYTGETGTVYSAGETLNYIDKLAAAEEATLDPALYEFPSQYEAFREFCSLSMGTSQAVTDKSFDGTAHYGYGISPNPNTLANVSRAGVISGKIATLCAMGLSEVADLARVCPAVGIEYGVCPMPQYREFNEDGTLKMVNGVPAVGIKATHSNQTTMVVNRLSQNPKAAVKFVNWWASEEAQRMYVQTGRSLSCRHVVNSDAEVQAIITEKLGVTNMAPLLEVAPTAMQGDWAYTEDGNWITAWANRLNTDVRNGVMTLDAFWATYEGATNDQLVGYKIHKFR